MVVDLVLESDLMTIDRDEWRSQNHPALRIFLSGSESSFGAIDKKAEKK
jgi:hypothetical protein